MSGDVSPARRPGTAASRPDAGRRTRLAIVVAVACVLVAVGLTGAGLLVDAGSPTPWLRLVAVAVGVAAGGVLIRLDGAARGVTTLAVVSGTAALTCLATFPVSSVGLGIDRPVDIGKAPTDGSGQFGGVPGGEDGQAGGSGGGRPGAVTLPPGTDVSLEDGSVVLGLPDGSRVVIGQAVPGATGVPPEGTSLAVVDGVVTRDDGVPVGPEIALGGTTLERGDGTAVVVGDDTLLDVPPPVDGTSEVGADGRDALLALLLATFALLAFAPPLVRFAERHDLGVLDEPDWTPEPEIRPETMAMEDGLAEVLRSMLADPDPRTAVIGAYGRLLTALAEAGAPRRDEEGPHEHLWRSLGPLGVRRQPLHKLAELFVLARFTPHPVDETHRQAAIAALADAVGDLRLQAADIHEAAALAGLSDMSAEVRR